MSKDVLDYQTPQTPEERRAAKSPVAAAIRLVALAIVFLGGCLMIAAGAVSSRPTGEAVGALGFLFMVFSAIAFIGAFFAAPR